MSNDLDMFDKRHVFTDCDDKYACKIKRSEHNYRQVYEYDKKMKREIANSNERRRMQSINTGFETLKELLPMSIDGEKLSKASILQLTAKYIQTLLSRLSTLEKEIDCFKKISSNKDKSPPLHSQEHNRKRRLNSCTTDIILSEEAQTKEACLDSISLTSSKNSLLTCDNTDKTPGSLEHLVAAIEQVEGERFYVSCSAVDKQSHSDCSSIGKEVTSREESPVRQFSQVTNLLNKSRSNHSMGNSAVMKPTISPYTEKIIRAVSQHSYQFDSDFPEHLFNTDSRSIHTTLRSISSDDDLDSIIRLHPIKSYTDVVIQKNKTL